MFIAVFKNDGNPTAARSVGSWPISRLSGFLRSFLHSTHPFTRTLAMSRIPNSNTSSLLHVSSFCIHSVHVSRVDNQAATGQAGGFLTG